MTMLVLMAPGKKTVPLTLVTEKDYAAWLKRQVVRVRNWLGTQDYQAKSGRFSLIPGADGTLDGVVAGISAPPSLWDIAGLSSQLPEATYHLDWVGNVGYVEWLALGWVLGGYKFSRYKSKPAGMPKAKLALPVGTDIEKIMRFAEAIALARDLINTPAEDMMPADLAAAIGAVGKKYKAKVTHIVGDALLTKNYPAIHTVGRASVHAPRLVDLIWGNPKHPKVTLVGKGVCFDTGGLDIKGSGNMYLMKKDMGGAACALAVAQMVMAAKLPVRLRLLVPAVENAVAGNAYRPSDVIRMRNGMTVEVGNTDAEGRLVMADALAEASREKPDMLIDLSTLTGAARTAVGTEISAFFTNDDALAERIAHQAKVMEDPAWRLPLYAGYDRMLDSPVADVNSAPGSAYAGAITAALFLQKFVGADIPWAHFDFMAWNLSSRAGRPEGGEAMAVRALYQLIKERVAA